MAFTHASLLKKRNGPLSRWWGALDYIRNRKTEEKLLENRKIELNFIENRKPPPVYAVEVVEFEL